MDVFDLSADMHTQLEYYPVQCYNAGFAHGAVSVGIVILFIWMSVWQCIQPRHKTIRERLYDAERDL